MDPDFNPSRKTLITNKWVSTVSSIWIQCTSGSLYTFSVYSAALKSSQGYDQATLDTVSVFKDFGANFGVFSGLLYSAASPAAVISDYGGGGPWVVLLVGAVLCFLGYFLMWLTVTGFLPRPHVLVMCLYMLLASNATTFFNTANVVTGVRNFPRYGGTIVGIMKGYLGLSGAILIQVYQTIFKNRPTSYLLMLSILPACNTLLLMFFVRIFKTDEEDEMRHLNGFSVVAMVLAGYLMAVIITENVLRLQQAVHVFTFVVLILLLVSPLLIAIYAQRVKSYRIVKSLLEHNLVVDEQSHLQQNTLRIEGDPTDYHEVPESADDAVNVSNDEAVPLARDLNLFRAMGTTSFWFLFLTTACGMGSGLATVNNISQIGGSLGYSAVEINTLVSLWSIWNYLGRFGAGYVSDYFLHEKGWPRPLFIVITQAVMSIGHAVIASGLPGALYAGSVLVGICYGSQWSLMPTVVSDIFGFAHMGTIFNTITIASPLGSYFLSVRVLGYIYDKEASGEGNTCIGSHCFMLSFLIMASATFFGCLVALALFCQTRNFYRHVLHKRLLQPIRD